jgi:hypothetical protein
MPKNEPDQLEERYYIWLLFAPARSPTWRNLIKKLYKERNFKLLDIARELRPKEYGMNITDQ